MIGVLEASNPLYPDKDKAIFGPSYPLKSGQTFGRASGGLKACIIPAQSPGQASSQSWLPTASYYQKSIRSYRTEFV